MKILLVDHNIDRLKNLLEYIEELYPDDEIVAEADSLMAGKTCFLEPYDIVLANLNDRRLDGLKMKEFARHSNPKAKYIICGETSELYERKIIDAFGNIRADSADGVIAYPVTKEKLLEALGLKTIVSCKNHFPENGAANGELEDDELEYVAAGYSDAASILDDALKKCKGTPNNPPS